MTYSRPGPSRNRTEPEQEDQDRVRNDAGLDAAGTGPVHAEPDVDVREDESMEVDRARGLPGRREADPGEGKGAGAAPSNSLDS